MLTHIFRRSLKEIQADPAPCQNDLTSSESEIRGTNTRCHTKLPLYDLEDRGQSIRIQHVYL